MSDDPIPEADARPGAPHPRFATTVYGHRAAEEEVISALASRPPHAWLLAGPDGIGKATFAWRMARALLCNPDEPQGLPETPSIPGTLDVSPDHPVARRIAALAEPRLCLIRRGWDDKERRLETRITVDEVRRLGGFFGMTSADGGRRVVIVDAADEMTPNAANALLKLLEEPPPRAVLLLVSHNPSRILPTIRSRCRTLRLGPLAPADLASAIGSAMEDWTDATDALTELAEGSPGRALSLIEQNGLGLYRDIIELLDTAPRLDRARLLRLADGATGRGTENRRDLILRLIQTALWRIARTGAGHPPKTPLSPDEARVMRRLAPSIEAARDWAALFQSLSDRTAHAIAVNLDPSGIILDMVHKANRTAGRHARP